MARLLYLHGSGHTEESFANQAGAIAGSESLTLPGHPVGEPLRSVAGLAEWLSREIDARAASPAVICGNSLGSAVALKSALTYPDRVAGLILIGAGARLRVGSQIFEMLDHDWPQCVNDLVGYSVDAACPEGLRLRLRAMHVVVGQRSTRVDYSACNDFDIMEGVSTIVAPTLVIVGSNDRMTPPKYASFLHDAIAGSRLVLVDGAGHLPHLERPEIVNDEIRAFLAENHL